MAGVLRELAKADPIDLEEAFAHLRRQAPPVQALEVNHTVLDPIAIVVGLKHLECDGGERLIQASEFAVHITTGPANIGGIRSDHGHALGGCG